MTPALIGKKIGMTRIYDDKGGIVPVTVVQAMPNHVTQVKTVESDGYNAVQLGFGDIKPRFSTFPLMGHTAKAGIGPKKHFREIRLKDATDKQPGDEVTVGIFDGVQFVDVRAAQHGISLNASRNRNRAAHAGVGALGVIDDLLGRRVQRAVIVSFHPNSNPRAIHIKELPNRRTNKRRNSSTLSCQRHESERRTLPSNPALSTGKGE